MVSLVWGFEGYHRPAVILFRVEPSLAVLRCTRLWQWVWMGRGLGSMCGRCYIKAPCPAARGKVDQKKIHIHQERSLQSFSLHLLFRNKLQRCFILAIRGDRRLFDWTVLVCHPTSSALHGPSWGKHIPETARKSLCILLWCSFIISEQLMKKEFIVSINNFDCNKTLYIINGNGKGGRVITGGLLICVWWETTCME